MDNKEFLVWFRTNQLDAYGSVIAGDAIRRVLGLEYPEVGTKKQFDEIALKELGAIDYLRNQLLKEGKYLQVERGDYRILLPSENARQIELYMQSADRKLRRAIQLNRNTPTQPGAQADQTDARLLMKRESIRSTPVMGRVPPSNGVSHANLL